MRPIVTPIRAWLALQTAARRKRNGLVAATVGLATNGHQHRYGVHVVASDSPIGR